MSKIVIYQVFPRYFGNACKSPVFNGSIEQNDCGKLNDFNRNALESIRDLGVSHVWFTGILEHATQTDYSVYGIAKDHPAIVKGKAGSPYAVKDYYDVDPDLAVDPTKRIVEFQKLLERTHQAGLKAIIDFVPNHVARQYHSDACPSGVRDFGVDDLKDHAFYPDNNFYYLPGQVFLPQIDRYAGCKHPYSEFPVKATGNDCFSASPNVNDWYETVKLNYGVDYQGGEKYIHNVPATWFKMLDILSYWTKMGVDGFRCDMAEMVPVEFWGWVIPRVKKLNQSVIFIAEVYNPKRYRDYVHQGCFDYLYDKVGLYNTLRAIVEGHTPTSYITNCWQSVNDIQSRMLYFLENHDEQRLASTFFAGDPFKGFPAFIVSACMQTNPVMIYSGQELGESGMYEEGFSGLDGRSTIFEYWSIESLAAWNNSGKWNDKKLSVTQKSVRAFYHRILNLCVKEKALSSGSFFDLMYNNYTNPGFDSAKQFAFLRKFENEIILVVVNFSAEITDCNLLVPKHAFDCLEIPDDQSWEATDLLTDKKISFKLSSTMPVMLELPAYSGVLLKFSIV